ncbi:glycosyltransferase family 4 protein [Polaribacter undariae]|uniref:Glycosyltransferase family 4 protein n=1 Tax=Polaribacter sejongensis TaxID=985043 RepID=A0AAJ1QYJ7_9FLAO|nr:glycosyltransferase family 4 protein [Polaribacter undariae]MDN3620298.1 glycosyltransferase family 4 protein [Polaribacter undariae]UWD32699.1 glycosyltransferase family 4 protein [Polaribacter undariae]
MKIVYIINSLENSGGMERVLTSKVNWLASQREFDLTIISRTDNKNGCFFELNKNITVENLSLKQSNNKVLNLIPKTDRKEFKKELSKKLFELKPDITISMFGDEYQFLHTIKDGSKKIIEFHFSKNYLSHLMANIPNLSFRRLRKLYASYLQYKQQRVVLRYDKFVLLTEKDQLLWNNPANSSVISNPLSFNSIEKSNGKQKEIIAIGRFIAQKGFDLLIKSFSLIAKNNPDWKVIIYGEGQDKDYLLELIKSYNLQNVIFLKPPTKNIKEALLNSSILAFPSRYEGFGLVLTEAMECGVPCVAFNCECGPSEIITDEKDGYLIEGFNVENFSKSLEKLMINKELRLVMGKTASQNVKRFHIDEIMSKWTKLFNDTI